VTRHTAVTTTAFHCGLRHTTPRDNSVSTTLSTPPSYTLQNRVSICYFSTQSASASSVCTTIFTARRHASPVYAVVVCLSVCLTVTSRCSTETIKRSITQMMPSDSSFLVPKISAKFKWGRPPKALNADGVSQNWRLSINYSL